MLNGVNLNYVIVMLVTGAVLLAAIYHSILYLHRKSSLLSAYSIYLWSTFAYCGLRSVYIIRLPEWSRDIPLDEMVQMVSFAMYIRFAAIALDLDPVADRNARRFARLTPYFVGAYLLAQAVIVNVTPFSPEAYIAAKVVIRTYLLLIGLLMLLIVIKKRRSTFYRYLGAGAISMILCGFTSSIVNLAGPSESFILGALSWLMFGFFLDVVFFSAAIGYRIRQEHNEREESLKQLLKKEAELQQKELEKLRTIYETREEERLRIARDLHDDMGSSLSSIGIYSKVASSYVEKDKAKTNEFLQKIQNQARVLMENISDLIWSLQTNYGTEESIFKRMQASSIEMLSSANITPHVFCEPEERLPRLSIAAQKNCWLIFKEALNNVCKYSNASCCHIEMRTGQEQLLLSIKDDGIGFGQPRRGNGLRNMISRANSMNGTCLIESSPGHGTLIKLSLPLISVSTGEMQAGPQLF